MIQAPDNTDDFEEALRVHQIDTNTWEGVHPLRLPIQGARGVYGGHMCAQTLLVAIESAPGYVPLLFHSHFIKPGNPRVVARYNVENIRDDVDICVRQIHLIQKGQVMYLALCTLVKKGSGYRRDLLQVPPPALTKKYRDPELLHQSFHTDFIRNAYSDEFVEHELCPEEKAQDASERWISLWSRLHQPHKSHVSDSKFNFVGLADLSDAVILTTLARVMHLDWNPTVDNPFEEYDEGKDARQLMHMSLNGLHLFHYQAMSLDHHIYFHCDDFDAFNVIGDWTSLAYQFKISKNHRSLLRGYFFDKNDRCIATFVQEGLTILHAGVVKDQDTLKL